MATISYEISEPRVVSEIIDGEAIIMDMTSGVYYSTDGVGAAIWQALLDQCSLASIRSEAARVFADTPQAADEIEAFLAELHDKGLTRETSMINAAAAAPTFAPGYVKPQLSSHEDMQDLIQLDPIHDVDEIGWPARKQEP